MSAVSGDLLAGPISESAPSELGGCFSIGGLRECAILYAPLCADRAQPGLDDIERWLSNRERHEVSLIRHASRRTQWLIGRALAKRVVRSFLPDENLQFRHIEICSRSADGTGHRPEVFVDDARCECSLSISHTERGVCVAGHFNLHERIGLDLVEVEPCAPGFVRTWFHPAEQIRLALASPLAIAAHWAAKEAVFKAAQMGERFVPGELEIDLPEVDRLAVRYELQALDCHACRFNLCDLSRDCRLFGSLIDRQVLIVARIGTNFDSNHRFTRNSI